MPRDEQQRAERGEGARKAASENQAQASGRATPPPGFVPGGQAGSGPINVQIVNGENEFFASLREALGMGSAGAGAGESPFQTQLKSQQAISQAAQQISQDVKSVLSMMKTMQMSNLQLNTQLSQALSQIAQNHQSMLNAITYGSGMGGGSGGGGGGGGHGHGGGGGGGGRYNPSTKRFVSYGSLQSRARAGIANYINNNYGANVSKHSNVPQSTRRTAATVAGGVADSGIMGGLERLPVIGSVIGAGEAVNQGAQFLTQQRAQNAYYQGIYGGSNADVGDTLAGIGVGGNANTTSGLGNRMQEEGFVLGQRFSAGGMTEDQSRQAFQQISALGLNGNRRGQALDFVSNSYRNMGMDPGQATQVAQVATRYAQTNLNSVYDSLMKVSQAAQVTGQSADTLRQVFVGNYQGALSGGAQGGAAGLAQAMTMATAAGGRNLQGFSYASMMQNPSTMYAMASRVGATPTQLEYQSAMGNNVPMAQAMTQQSGALMQSALGQQGQQVFNQLVQQAGGNAKVAASPGTISHIATQLLPHVDTATIRSMVQASGITIPEGASDEQILNLMVNQLVGNTPAAAAQQQQAAAAPQKISQQELDKGKPEPPGVFGIRWRPPNPLSDFGKGMSDWTAQQLSDAQKQQGGFDETFGNLLGGNDHSKAANQRVDTVKAYADYQKKFGNVSDQAIQQAISMFGNDPNMRIRVRTKDGTDRAVSLQEAIQYYPDQLSTGQATVMNNDADQNGKSLAELGITPSLAQGKLMPNEEDTTTSGQEYGQDAASQEKNFQPKAKDTTTGPGGQQVTIDFAPGAAQTLLRVVGQGAPNARPPAATNGPN